MRGLRVTALMRKAATAPVKPPRRRVIGARGGGSPGKNSGKKSA